MSENLPDSERVMRIAHGHWQAAGMAAAVRLGVFDALESGVCSPSEVASATGISTDMARMLLEALVGMDLVRENPTGHYENTSAASAHLVRGRGGYLGDLAETLTGSGGVWNLWRDFGSTFTQPAEVPDDFDNASYMRGIARAIMPMTDRAAEIASERLRSKPSRVERIVDIGGGSGVFSQVLLRNHPEATALQIDGPLINEDARERMRDEPEAPRFDTLDGRFPDVDLTPGSFDVAVYSGFSHQVSAYQNLRNLGACSRLLRPGGTIVFHDYLSHTGSEHESARITNLNWLLVSFGAVWPLPTVHEWLMYAGFHEPATCASTGFWTTVLTAEKRDGS